MAKFDQLPVLRVVAEALAVLGDFNLDEVADITLAVDEVWSQLTVGASQGSELRCLFMLNDTELSAAVSVQVTRDFALRRDGFGWHVLETAADSVSVERQIDRFIEPNQELTVRIVKQRAGAE